MLLTAAKNEQAYITAAIQSVLRQTLKPLAWFIVDDGSTDQTAGIIERFAAEHPFIRLVSASSHGERSFGSQYRAIQAAYELAKALEFDFVGVQDADIAPERDDYYKAMLVEFERNPRLGIAGGYVYEMRNGAWQRRHGNSEDSVPGGVQMFRRACFDEIGGYTPLHYGGSDWLAQLDARMKGWEVLTRPDLRIFHYRSTSTASGQWRGLLRVGFEDASFGCHPMFEVLKCCRRLTHRPFLLGAALRLSGYCWWVLSGRKPVIPPEKVAYLRNAQWAKICQRFRSPRAEPRPQEG
jgi:GT2 family glycosyltransferase